MNEEMKKEPEEEKIPLPALENELKRERYRIRFYKMLRSTLNVLVVVAAFAAIIATLFLPVLQIAGTSMEPNLADGDIVLLIKTEKLKRGDLCAFYFSNKILVKRVIALPGDYVQIDSSGVVSVNGEVLNEPYVEKLALGECDLEFPYQVPENNFFVLGDQRETSIDSRSSVIGCVAKDQVVGKIFFKVWPLKDFKAVK